MNASEIFQKVGGPLYDSEDDSELIKGFRAFSESDIAEIITQAQREILKEAQVALYGCCFCAGSQLMCDPCRFFKKHAELLSDSEREGK